MKSIDNMTSGDLAKLKIAARDFGGTKPSQKNPAAVAIG